ncbi:hypothetical protein EGT07_10170 [Herbaspirillum sp. HC18]|nr:hypothetical protein EGT07_10170 [Herbaspirillum sp. HC18]
MHALDLRDNALLWETERQNQILQNALEQKKKQVRVEPALRDAPGSERAPIANAVPPEEWVDKFQRIPEIRSALMPFENEEEGWSKPFLLTKADMEPWLSFYRGYRQSRLFLEPAAGAPGATNSAALYMLDFPVRALVSLRQVDARLFSDPPVQINGQVEYLDLDKELGGNLSTSHVRSVLSRTADAHERLIKTAVKKGHEMGDALYEALLGEGHANLIKAWEKAYKRKPTIEELHQMLTTGRVWPSSEKKASAAEARQKTPEPLAPVQAVRSAPLPPAPPPAKEALPRLERGTPDSEDDDEAIVTLSSKKAPAHPNRKRRFVWPLIHAVLGCAALAAYLFLF